MARILRAFTLDLAVVNALESLSEAHLKVLLPSTDLDAHGLTAADYDRMCPSPPSSKSAAWARPVDPWTRLQARLSVDKSLADKIETTVRRNRANPPHGRRNASRIAEAILNLGLSTLNKRMVAVGESARSAKRNAGETKGELIERGRRKAARTDAIRRGPRTGHKPQVGGLSDTLLEA